MKIKKRGKSRQIDHPRNYARVNIHTGIVYENKDPLKMERVTKKIQTGKSFA
jgi:hypothetical protein